MTCTANEVILETWSAMDDRSRYWFGAKVGLGYRPPLSWRGWVAYAVWMTAWLAATPFINAQEHPLQSLGFFFGWIAVLLGVIKWKGEP
jgi:hypothetical protein